MREKISKYKSKIILIGIILTSILLYFFNTRVNETINNIFSMFATGDFKIVKDFIDEYGTYAMLVSAALMIFQSIMAPLPAFIITFANANLFGWWQGAILSWSSAMLGAILCFYISRILGRDMVEKLTSKVGLESVDKFFEKHGKHSILIARLLPFISFDIVSYGAGLTSMTFLPFVIATGLGQLPATVIYSYVGGMLTGGVQLLVTGLLMLFALSIFFVLIKNIFYSKEAKENR
ncbi:TVP38/TMEM64 family protein [Tissierella creatinophila]|uniref:TVP38/TMEM64 family membrane protein n=1 Tax=Tissierella creatinophila DSM 6911 TaxID=1123403 RepID=A0A1U7M615_TISCR|nr:TVP38/TMEM64 family protein [Tissierella creatinophila]OLS02763.1 TVP38/TMEM64 family inner membrane protein YdjZ [Tissierella creatinophila DSM 6911]